MAHGKPSVIYLVQFAGKRNRKNKLIAKLIPVPKVENLQRQTTLFCDEGKCKFVLHFLMIEKVRFPFYWTTLKFPHILTLISSLVSGEICVVLQALLVTVSASYWSPVSSPWLRMGPTLTPQCALQRRQGEGGRVSVGLMFPLTVTEEITEYKLLSFVLIFYLQIFILQK